MKRNDPHEKLPTTYKLIYLHHNELVAAGINVPEFEFANLDGNAEPITVGDELTFGDHTFNVVQRQADPDGSTTLTLDLR